MPLSLLILLFALLGVGAALVSAVETALFVLREHRVPVIARDNDRLAERLARLHGEKRAFMNLALLLSALFNLALAATGLALHARLVAIFPVNPGWLALALIVAIVLAADLLPKLLCLGRPREIFLITSGPLLALRPILGPVANGLARLSDRIVGQLTPAAFQPRARIEEDELETLVEMRRDTGLLDEAESEMIQEVLKLREKTAKDCMTPRVELTMLAEGISPADADLAIRAQSFERLPVYNDIPDNLTGVLDVLGYLRDSSPQRDFREHVQPAVFVPETMRALDLFEKHLRLPDSMVIVLDEFGGFEGIVTQTDIIEDIIGDAAPDGLHPQEIGDLGEGLWLTTGSARLDDLSESTGVNFEEDGLDTIGGLVTTLHGSVPRQGTMLVVKGATATVRKSNARRVEELLLDVSNLTDDTKHSGEEGA